MNKASRRLTTKVATLGVLALTVAACGNSSSSGSGNGNQFDPSNFNPSWLAANQNSGGTPVQGGTLKIEGSTDLSAALDPQGEYETIGYQLERAMTRQLVAYNASTSLATSETIAPDVATAMPTVSSDGKTYTFHLKTDVMWDTTPVRAVKSQDFVLGLKRICDPTLAPNGNPGYYIATIAGFKEFCNPFLNMDPGSTAAARKDYIDKNNISGVTTPDDHTLVINLTQPASDFLYIMALPFASAAPVEDLKFVPLTAGNPIYSDGPYSVSKYDVGHELDLSRNNNWKDDSLRHNYVDAIDVKLDLAGSSASTQVQQDMETGQADLSWNTIVPTDEIAKLSDHHDAGYGAFPAPGTTNPYLVFNVMSPNNGGALGKVKVRQALEYAIDKTAIGKIYGGPDLNQPLDQVLGPGAQGYQQYNLYPANNDHGDAAKCKSMLSAAGYPNGLQLKDYYRDNGNHPAVYQEVLSDFGKCGVTVTGTPIATGYYGSKGIGVTQASDLTKGNWDITEPGWVPDWFSSTNARAIVPPLFDGALSFPGTDWGGYDNPSVDSAIDKALADSSSSQAASDWHTVDMKIMQDAPFIPFQTQLTALYHSKRVHNALYNPFSTSFDVTQVWLS